MALKIAGDTSVQLSDYIAVLARTLEITIAQWLDRSR